MLCAQQAELGSVGMAVRHEAVLVAGDIPESALLLEPPGTMLQGLYMCCPSPRALPLALVGPHPLAPPQAAPAFVTTSTTIFQADTSPLGSPALSGC